MKTCIVQIKSASPYSQSRQHDVPKLNAETADAYENRTWREKCTVDDDGMVCIPAMGFKQALDAVAKRLSLQIPGKGKATYTKHFKAGVICLADVPLGILKTDVQGVTINANADGVRGSGKRVKRTFPIINNWEASARFALLDDAVTSDIFERHLREAGQFIGIGRFRPENGGLHGRFTPIKFAWEG